MKTSGTFLTVLLVFILFSNLKAQTYPLSDFVETVLPKPKSPERAKVFRSGYQFVVNISSEKLIIREYKRERVNEEVQLSVDNGKLVGTNKGEFIGKLLFVSDSYDTTIIRKANIHFLFKYNGEIYFIEGLRHMGTDEGALYKIVFLSNKYRYQKILDFDDAPEVMCIVNGDILVASLNSFYKIHNLRKEKIFPDLLADDLFPRSLVGIDNRHVYMGTTGGYIQIDLVAKFYKFYRYNTSP